MIARGPIRKRYALVVALLTAALVGAGFGTHPASALAATAAHTITFELNGAASAQVTTAATVGDFLRERKVTVGPNDFVDPSSDAPLSDGMVVTYRSAVAMTIQIGERTIETTSSAENVGALLAEQNIALGPRDTVEPGVSDPLTPGGVVHVDHIGTWTVDEKHILAPKTIHRYDFSMTPGTTKTVARGTSGERDAIVRYTVGDDGTVTRWIVASRITRHPHPRIVVVGVDEYAAYAKLEARGVASMEHFAQSAMHMVATAYTANCSGCGGVTASGRRAGHGVVAVDPHVIPLGSRLYISGYGPAVAGDTGGAIHGLRIDLGFNSLREAMLFGRREVTVYRLK